MDEWFRVLINQNLASRNGTQIAEKDLLQALLGIAEKAGLTDEETASHALTLFINGFESSSSMLTFLLYELARNPVIQQQVHDEIVAVNSRHRNEFSYAALQDMEYLQSVIHGEQLSYISHRMRL